MRWNHFWLMLLSLTHVCAVDHIFGIHLPCLTARLDCKLRLDDHARLTRWSLLLCGSACLAQAQAVESVHGRRATFEEQLLAMVPPPPICMWLRCRMLQQLLAHALQAMAMSWSTSAHQHAVSCCDKTALPIWLQAGSRLYSTRSG